MIKTIFLLVPLFFGIIAFFKLLSGEFFDSFLWSFVSVSLLAVVLPILLKTEKRFVPVYQMFSMIFFIFLATTSFVYFEFQRLGHLSFVQGIVYSVFVGLIITSIIAVVRPK